LIIAFGIFPDLSHPMINASVTPVVQRLNGASQVVQQFGNPLPLLVK
jgi:hypothetical protein